MDDTSNRDMKLFPRQLQEIQVLRNFLLECEQARNEPVDLKLILFEDENYSHEELIEKVMQRSAHSNNDTCFTKQELRVLLDALNEEIKR